MSIKQYLGPLVEKAVAIITVVSMGVLAYLHPGVAVADVDLHDGGVWITNHKERLVGFLNYPSRIIESGLRSPSADFDIYQHAKHVTYRNVKDNQLNRIDPAQMTLEDGPELTASLAIAHNTDQWAFFDSNQGNVWATTTAQLDTFTTSASQPIIGGGIVGGKAQNKKNANKQLVTTVSTEGTIHTVTPSSHMVSTLTHGEYDTASTGLPDNTKPLFEGDALTVTTVGDQLVLYNPQVGSMMLPNHTVIDVPTQGKVQAPSGQADYVTLATPTALIHIGLDNGEMTAYRANDGAVTDDIDLDKHDDSVHDNDKSKASPKDTTDGDKTGGSGGRSTGKKAVQQGIPAQPARVGHCDYSAWGRSGNFLRVCITDGQQSQTDQTNQQANQKSNQQKGQSSDSKAATQTHADTATGSPVTVQALQSNSLTKATQPVFRVNRNVIVLNDQENGQLWLPEENMLYVENWNEVLTQIEDQESDDKETTYTDKDEIKPENKENSSPIAQDDQLGARAGRLTTLPVLRNDSDPDGDIIVAVHDNQPAVGTVSQVRFGKALQIELPNDASGPITFPYTVNDGRGGLAQANVTVTVSQPNQNGAPTQHRTSTVNIVARGKATYNPLPDFIDPDGDIVFLQDAEGEGVTVRFQENGKLFIEDVTGVVGERTISVTVSDGTETTKGSITLNVMEAGQYPPVLRPDHAIGVTDEVVTINPLANDEDPNGETLHLISVDSVPKGVTVTPDLTSGTIAFTSPDPGSHVFKYTVSNGPHTASNIIRVDLIPAQQEVLAPIVENDQVYLPENGMGLANVLANDIDPAGGVLVVQSVDVSQNSGLVVQMVDHTIARVTATKPLKRQKKFSYTASNGKKTTRGEVTVLPVPAVQADALPEAFPDTALVREGDLVTVPVLQNDRSPSGSPLTLDQHVDTTIRGDEGEVFVSGNTLRYKAGKVPGTFYATYTARDNEGNIASAKTTFQVVTHGDNPQETNQAPVPKSVTSRVLAGSTVRIDVPLEDVDPDGDSVMVAGLDTAPTLGTVTTTPTGFTYTADPQQSGTDVFTYTLQDRLGKTGVGTIRVGVASPSGRNQLPVASDDVVRVKPDRDISIAVLANDIDPDGDSLVVVPDSLTYLPEGSTQPQPAGNRAKVANNRVVLTSPTSEQIMRFMYTVDDGRGGQDSAQVMVTVDPDAPAVAPIARDDHISFAQALAQGSPIVVDVLANDEDLDGSIADLTVESLDDNAVVNPDNTISVTVTKEPQIIMYTITDVDKQVGKAAIYVPGVDPNRTPPQLKNTQDFPLKTIGGKQVTIDLTNYVSVRSGRSPRITVDDKVHAGPGSDGSLPVIDLTTVQYTPTTAYTGDTSITFEVTDGADLNDPQAIMATLSIPITVEPGANIPPVFSPTKVMVAAGEDPVEVNLAPFISDPNGDDPEAMSYELVSSPQGITGTIAGSTVTVGAALATPKGPVGDMILRVNDGSGPVEAAMPIEVIGSSKPLISVSPVTIDDAIAGNTVTVDVAQHSVNPFPQTPLTLASGPVVSEGKASVSANGLRLAITPTPGHAGRVVVTYSLMDATKDSDRNVSGTVTLHVTDKPGPPTNVAATAQGGGAMHVSWTPGPANGKPITGAIVKHTGSGKETECTGTACTITGLENGLSHSFTVATVNAIGTSAFSAPSTPVHLDVAPDTPGAPTIVAGNQTVTATWVAPRSLGSAITHYTVSLQGSSSVTQRATGTTATFSGLQNGQTYWVTVQAHNLNPEPSQVSAPSAKVTPFGPPKPVRSVQLSSGSSPRAGEHVVNVSWSADALRNGLNNGAEMIAYHVSISGGSGAGTSKSVSGSATSTSFNLPQSPNPYVATVVVETKAGRSSPVSSAPLRMFGQPSAIAATVEATGVSNQVKVTSITPPSSLQGWSMSDISYVIGGQTVQVGSVIGGLTNGKPIALEAYALASSGSNQMRSPTTTTNQIIPYGPPSALSVACRGEVSQVTCDVSGQAGNGRPASVWVGESEGSLSSTGSLTKVFSNVSPGEARTWCAQGRYGADGSNMRGPVACDRATALGSQPQPEPTQPQPEPTQPQLEPTQPQPEPTQPQPDPEPTQPQPEPTQPQPEPTQPQPDPEPQPDPDPEPQPDPDPEPEPEPKPEPTKPDPPPPPPKPKDPPDVAIFWGADTSSCPNCKQLIGRVNHMPGGGANCYAWTSGPLGTGRINGAPTLWFPNNQKKYMQAWGGVGQDFRLVCDTGHRSHSIRR